MIIEDKKLYLENLPKDSSLFYQPWYLDSTNPQWTAFLYIEKERIIWMLPGVKSTKLGVNHFIVGRFMIENAPIILIPELFESRQLSKIPIIGFINFNSRDIHLNDALIELNIHSKNKEYQFFNLKGAPNSINSISKSLKKKFSKLESSTNLVLEDNLSSLIQLHRQSFRRRNLTSIDNELLLRIYENLRPYTYQRCLVLYKENVPISARWVIAYGNTVYGILSGKNYEENINAAQEYLLWKTIQFYRNDYKTLDMCGSSIEGVKQFHLKIGAHNRQYKTYYLVNTPIPILNSVLQRIIIRYVYT